MAECPDFDLAPLTEHPPNVLSSLSPDPEQDAFILSLALGYNDLNGMYWLLTQLEACGPEDPQAVTAESGQWNGMKIQVTRFMLGLTHEILVTVGEAGNKKLLNHGCGRRAKQRLKPKFKRAWRELEKSAQGDKGTTKSFRKYLAIVRNKGAFHYNDAKFLMKGYDGFFNQEKVTERNRVAMSSIVTTLEATRFHFADAAVQHAYTIDLDPGGDLFKLSNRFLRTVLHVGLRGLVEAYLVVRESQIQTDGAK